MSWSVRLSREAHEDLEQLVDFILDREARRTGGGDPMLAMRAQMAIEDGLRLLARYPFTCRKAHDPLGRIPVERQALIRELVIPFGATGYVALFEIADAHTVVVLAVRHQREEDFH